MKIGKSKDLYYVGFEQVDAKGKAFFVPVYGPFDTKDEARQMLEAVEK